MTTCDHAAADGPPVGARRLNRFVVPGVLLLLAEKATHGYELGARLAALGFIENENDTALVYRALNALSAQGCVTASEEPGEGGPPRKVYALTASGRELLDEWRVVIGERVDALSRFLDRYAMLEAEKGGRG